MEEKEMEGTLPQEQPQGYVPRPKSQVWMARVGLVVMILFVIYQIVALARGGI